VRLPALAVTCLYFFITHTAASAFERRCGWLHNPTPANWWLVDKDGTWILMRQGETEPAGFEIIPDISKRYYVKTNGNYGYTCACIGGDFSIAQKKVSRLTSFNQRPLSACRNDRALPKP
jgi:Protein of unknown function (DUF4087)